MGRLLIVILVIILALLITSCEVDNPCDLSFDTVVLADGDVLEGCSMEPIYGEVIVIGNNVEIRNLVLDGRNIKPWGIYIRPGSKNVLIENVEVMGYKRAGIQSDGHWPDSMSCERIVVRNVRAHHNLGDPEFTYNHSGSGIVLGGCVDCLIEDSEAWGNGELTNSKYRNGPVGIWFWFSMNSEIRNSYSHDNRTREEHHDGGGFDLDGGCINCRITNCKSENNMGAGYLLWHFSGSTPTRGNTITNSSSTNDGSGIQVGPNVKNTVFSGMTIDGEVGYNVQNISTTIEDSYICAAVNVGTPILINTKFCNE